MTFTIRRLIEKVSSGQIQIPAFQRGFVWDAEKVADLVDSIYKGFPFGTLLFWRTKEELANEKRIGPFELIESEKDFPIDYVLDGQQRITSIFGVFQTDLTPIDDASKLKIYFDFSAEEDLQETQFIALSDDEVEKDKHFPLNTFFDTIAYRKATENLDDATKIKIDEVQTRFKEASVPIQTLETDDKEKVAIVFERINRKGVELDTFQLLSAWTWSEEFDLNDKFGDLCNDLSSYGFKSVGEDIDIILKCSAAVLSNNASAKALINLKGSEVRDRFDEIENGIKGALDFLNMNVNVYTLKNLPSTRMLIPLAAFFSNKGNKHFNYTNSQKDTLLNWFWIVSFTKRYSSSTLKSLNKDIVEMIRLKKKQSHTLDKGSLNITPDYFIDNKFGLGSISTKAFILMLSMKPPLSFISGSKITLAPVLKEYNKNEFHHIYPKAYLTSKNVPSKEINCLGNYCFLSRADNKKIDGDAPSIYEGKLPDDKDKILESAFCPLDMFDDDFDNFLSQRTQILADYANKLIK